MNVAVQHYFMSICLVLHCMFDGLCLLLSSSSLPSTSIPLSHLAIVNKRRIVTRTVLTKINIKLTRLGALLVFDVVSDVVSILGFSVFLQLLVSETITTFVQRSQMKRRMEFSSDLLGLQENL